MQKFNKGYYYWKQRQLKRKLKQALLNFYNLVQITNRLVNYLSANSNTSNYEQI
jgi:hypothetical protein